MHEVVDEKRSPSKKPFIFYAIIALLIIMLLNALVFPSMLQRSVIEVGYDQFLEMIDSGEVKEVSYDEYSGQFVFIAGEEKKEQIYKTGIWPEDGATAAAAAAGTRRHSIFCRHPDTGESAYILYFNVDFADSVLLYHRGGILPLDEKEDEGSVAGRPGQYHVLRKIRCENLCGRRENRGEIRQRCRTG